MNRDAYIARYKLVTAGRLADQKGLSLIELMIGLLVGLILLGGVLQTMLASKEAASARQNMAAITDNARFLFEFMARDLRMVGRGFSAGSAPLSYSVSASGADKVLTAEYYVPASGGSETLVEVTYTYDGSSVSYSRIEGGGGPQGGELIENVSGFEVAFGYVTSSGTSVTYTYSDYDDASVTWKDVVAIRTQVTFSDTDIGNEPIVSTVALRNRVAELVK